MNQVTASPPDGSVKRKRNHALWLGPLLTVVGIGSYFAWFIRFPTLRDIPWTSLLTMSGGIMISAVGLRRAYAPQGVYKGKLAAPLSLLFSMMLTAGFSYALFFLTYNIPTTTEVTQQLEFAPDFELVSQAGEPVRLSDFKGQKVVLDFYRGHW